MVNDKEIRKRMIDCGINSTKLADKCGVSTSAISNVLNHKSGISFSLAEKMQKALDIPDEEFTHYFMA